MDKIRKKHLFGAIEISVIGILTIALVIMFTSYCLLISSSSSESNSDGIYADAIFAPFDDSEGGKMLILPSFIGVCSEKMIAPSTPEAKNVLLNEAAPFITELFSDVSTTLEFSSEQSAYDYLENEISNHDEYLYISFPCDVPASAVCTLLGKDNAMELNYPFAVKDLYIFCDENGSLSGICTDKNGNTAMLAVRTRTSLSMESIRRYSDENEGLTIFDFAVYNNRKYPVFANSVANHTIAAYNDTEGNVLDDSQALSSILSSFGFDPYNTRFFRTGNTVTYVELFGELTVSEDGSVVYTREGSGLPLSELCGKLKDSYSFTDKINSAYNIISSLDRNIYGGYAQLALDGISYENGELTLTFNYTSDGIAIESSEKAATLVFGNDSLLYAKVTAQKFARLDNVYSDIPQKLLFTLFGSNFDEKAPHSFLPVYTKSENDETYSAKYAFIFDSDYSEGGAAE